MSILSNKVDFMMTLEVNKANPNGDPLNGNMPRDDVNGFGEMSDVSIKRKIRNRMQDTGHDIFVKSNERVDDGFKSLEKRYNSVFGKEKDVDVIYKGACEKWLDVRSFGQVITYQKNSIGIRGPISISIARSLSPVISQTMQITRSTNGMEAAVGKDRSSDTMGTKHFVDYGVYLLKGSINCFFAEKTGFTTDDKEVIKECLRTLFENDASSARPEGSMQVKEIFWFEHPSKTGVVSSAKIYELFEHKQLDVMEVEDYHAYGIQLNDERLNQYKKSGLKYEYILGL